VDVDNYDFPEFSTARLKAKVQVAADQYRHPTFIEAQLMVFSENSFAILIFDFYHIFIFERIKC
jgi:hypothetical protein